MKKFLASVLKNKVFNWLIIFLLLSNVSYSMNNDDEKNGHYQSHLKFNTTYMKKSSSNLYNFIVDDSIFNKIHEKATDSTLNPSACYVDANKISGCSTIFDISKNENITESKSLSAAHVVYDLDKFQDEYKDKKEKLLFDKFQNIESLDKEQVLYPTIYQGMFEHNGEITYIAKYQTDEVCFDKHLPRRDVVILKSKLTETPLNYDELKNYKSVINDVKYKYKVNCMMHHHPLGVLEQRINEGEVNPDGTHLIPTMPSTSGAGMHGKNDKKLSFIHNQGNIDGVDKVLYKLSHLEEYPDESKIFSTGSKNYSVPFSKDDLSDFTKCFKKNSHH